MSNKNDWIESQNATNTKISKGGLSRNILRPVYNDDSKNYDSAPVTKALTVASGISGTKSMHDSNAAFLALIPKEDKVGKRARKFKVVKNNLGKEVRQGRTTITRAKDAVKVAPKTLKKVKVAPINSLENLLKGIK